MHKLFFLPVVLLFVFPSEQVQAQTIRPRTQRATVDAKSLYEDGIKRLEVGQVSEAVERFQQALKIDPEYAEAYSALGRSFFKLRQWENAVPVLRRAIALKGQQRDRQAALHNNEVRAIKPGMDPANSANKPQRTNPINPDTTPGFITVKSTPPEERIPPKVGVATQPPNLSKPLPALRINTEIRLDSALTPPRPPRFEPAAQANKKGDFLKSEPPPLVLRKTYAVQPPAEHAIKVTTISPMVEAKTVSAASPNSSTEEIALTKIYRVGSKDVLDIRLNDSQSRQSTVYMVTQSGLLEHPHLSEPLSVSGLTVEEIRTRIEEDLKKHAVIEDPKVFVGVLEHASHTIVVDGLVKDPGTKSLKSEAVPLASVLAEAQPLVGAASVTVVRNGLDVLMTELGHTAHMGFLVHPGDVITLHPRINEFLYVGGKVKFPGEKRYRVGLTLMQAIIASGGATSNSKVAEIARDDGELVRTRFDLEAIESGKAADPPVKPRDRIILH